MGKLLSHVPHASRKDVRGAVEAAHAAKGWAKSTGHLRAQILYYIGENLEARRAEFAEILNTMQGGRSGDAEVAQSIDTLFTAAAWADKYDGQAHGVPMRAVALAMKEPTGVIAALCPDAHPLLGLIRLMAPAIAMGNTFIASASQPFPLATTALYQVLDTSDVPAGVVNILTGPHTSVAGTMAQHMDIDALWSFADPALAPMMREGSATNLKRTWIGTRLPEVQEVLEAATEIKNIWIPYGE